MVLAIDLGTTTGFATARNGLVHSGTACFRPARFQGGGMRYLLFAHWLDEMAALGPIESVWFEEVRRHAATDAAHVYGGLMATLTAWCERRGIPYAGIPVGTIKKHATGKGNADKAAMIAAARAAGFNPADDNEADALALLRYVMASQLCAAQGPLPAQRPAQTGRGTRARRAPATNVTEATRA